MFPSVGRLLFIDSATSRPILIMAIRLSDNARAREALRQCLPEPLRDATFSSVLRDDAATKRCLAQLLMNLSDNVVDASNNQGM